MSIGLVIFAALMVVFIGTVIFMKIKLNRSDAKKMAAMK
jgi:hypothetical protein